MHKRKKWLIKASEPVLQFILSRKLGISPLMAQLLVNRGIYTVEEAREFLDASLQRLHPPELMRDMSGAVEITLNALDRGQKILVYGDYDVDGVTGTALLVNLLRRLGGMVDYYIPHRVHEGYGLHAPVLHGARESGIGLVITVDCGISAVAEVEDAKRGGGPEIIITDHHEPPPRLPGAAAVINPKREDCRYPFKDLAGVGVAFKFGQALLERAGRPYNHEDYLDLVCLGTIADIVSLKGENRILVRHGLTRLAQSTRPGLRALCRAAGIKQDSLGAREVGYILAPRLNAAGRLGDAAPAVELLLSEDDAQAAEIAAVLNKENQERQQLETIVLAEALGMLEGDPALAAQKVLVLASPHWHPGVIGIVASRMVDRFYKPVLLIACEGEQGKGSARSINGFNLYKALEYCSGCLDGYGGHAMAAGFSIPVEQIERFRNKINEYAARFFPEEEQLPVLELDALVSLQDVTYDLINELEQLAPYGHGNPGPLFGLRRAKLINCRGVGKKNAHLKMLLGDRRISIDGIGFNLGQYAGELAAGREVSVAFTPSINSWQGREILQIKVKDLKAEAEDAGYFDDACSRDEQLRLAGDLIFVPETIIGLLREVLMERELDVPPEMKAVYPANGYSSKHGFLPECPAHSAGNTINQLARLTPAQGNMLLLVNSARHTLQLFRFIGDYNPHFAGKVTYIHGFMPPELIQKELRGVERVTNGLLVSTYGCLPYLHARNIAFDRVMLARPPVFEEDWRRVSGLFLDLHASRVPGIEALYAAKDWDDNRKHLMELAPERDMLAYFYAFLRSRAGNGQGRCVKTEVVDRMCRQGFHVSSWLSLAVAAAVFTDLGLLQYRWQQDMLIYKLIMPVRGSKKELSESPTYLRVHKIKSEGLNWINRARK
jgi:single-stranded-DNA-specific exonuclease